MAPAMYTYQLKRFNFGKARSFAPIMIGMKKLPNTPGNTGTKIDDTERQGREHPEGRAIAFGVREHAMGGILNGMSLHGGAIPIGGTFFVFSDYMRGSVRLAAISDRYVLDRDLLLAASPVAFECKRCELPRPPGGYDRVLKRVGIQYCRISSTTAGMSL